MRNYAAITIGPIGDTLAIAASPGTLWCASTMFSYLAGDLCENILAEITGAEIIVPAYNRDIVYTDGIGRFHDRIFFTCEMERGMLEEKLKKLCTDVKNTLAGHISDALGERSEKDRARTQAYIAGYVQLSWMVADGSAAEANGDNCILNLSPYLDYMELSAQGLPEETDSPIVRLLSGTADGSNFYIHHRREGKTNACWLIPKNPSNAFQLLKGNAVRDIGNIANPYGLKDGRKIHSYFAVVQSDGDNIGTFLSSCPPERVREFSKCCIEYAGTAAKLVGDYGGLTIYAGGDDLLFLAPVEGKGGKNLLTLCSEISQEFEKRFEALGKALGGAQTPTLSFGISVNYEKSPLYEALEDAKRLLFSEAKEGKKQQIALSMHKHSGKSVFLLFPNCGAEKTPMKKLIDLIDTSAKKQTDKTDAVLHSILYQIETFRTLFTTSYENHKNTQDLYDNLFDSAAHDMGRSYINKIKALGDVIAAFPDCSADNEKNGITHEPVDVLTSMLRFAKLYTERGVRE